MKKKLLSIILAATMAMGMSLTALAADTTDITAPDDVTGVYGAELSGTSTMTVPTIKVTVPTALSDIILNPYQIGVEVDGNTVTDSVITAAQEIASTSNVPLAVSITGSVSIAETSQIKFTTAKLTGKETTNSVFAYVEVAATEDGFTATYDKTITQGLVLGIKDATAANIITIPKSDGTTAQSVFFQVKGQVVPTPTNLWTKDDVFTAALKFTFTPQVAEAAQP